MSNRLTDKELAEGRLDLLGQAEDTIGGLRKELADMRAALSVATDVWVAGDAERDGLRAQLDRAGAAARAKYAEALSIVTQEVYPTIEFDPAVSRLRSNVLLVTSMLGELANPEANA